MDVEKRPPIEAHFLGFCPFCGESMLFLEEKTKTVRACPICDAPIAFREVIDLEKDSLGYEIIPNTEGESFYEDGFRVEKGLLVSYDGESDKLTTPKGVVAIAPKAFKGNRRLTAVTLSEGVRYVGNAAFEDCDGIKTVKLPQSLISLGSSAFARCRRLSAVSFPKGLRAAGGSLFHGCDYLTEVLFPMDMTYLGTSPYTFCKNLRVANIPDCVTSLGCNWFSENEHLEILYVGRNVSHLSCPSDCLRELHLSDPTGWMLYGPLGHPGIPIPEKEFSTPKAAASYLKKLKRERRTMFRQTVAKESYWFYL